MSCVTTNQWCCTFSHSHVSNVRRLPRLNILKWTSCGMQTNTIHVGPDTHVMSSQVQTFLLVIMASWQFSEIPPVLVLLSPGVINRLLLLTAWGERSCSLQFSKNWCDHVTQVVLWNVMLQLRGLVNIVRDYSQTLSYKTCCPLRHRTSLPHVSWKAPADI